MKINLEDYRKRAELRERLETFDREQLLETSRLLFDLACQRRDELQELIDAVMELPEPTNIA